MMVNLADLGYNDQFERFRQTNDLVEYDAGRIIAEYRERYIVAIANGIFDAEITGNMRFTASGREDFPAVGDWVAVKIFEPDLAIIHRIFPRYSLIKRLASGRHADVQLIAANVDIAFIVVAAGRDFNINRIERYLTICYESGVSPVIIFSKTDLLQPEEINSHVSEIKNRIKNVQVIPLSNNTSFGYASVKAFLKRGVTCCLLGSSGVGKSTLINNIAGSELMKTGSVSDTINRGKHITSHRELFILDDGGILIDNPGLREVGIADADEGLEVTFDIITRLSENCRYKDCTHIAEEGCMVIKAVENGEVDRASYDNYLRMLREKMHYESTLAERRMKDKQFGKMFKKYKKDMKRNGNL